LTLWKKEGKQKVEELIWITKHALRTLIKNGDKSALALLGFSNEVHANIERFALNARAKKITKDGILSFSFDLRGIKDESLLIDYVIDFVKANGGVKPKVFKLKKVSLRKGEKVTVSKNHRFVSDATTYTLYSGVHTLTLQINGQKCGVCTFEIV
jgi:predicted DNA-binding antitoxin AbrB/MazE fold protein